MNIRPLILRELRAESRRANTYWVRTLAASGITALFAWAALSFRGNPANLGPSLFNSLSFGFVTSILIIVSALTGDSISREKREGTLGLLFLTPLSAHEIVAGKCLLQFLRAIPIILAASPIIGLPFLLGGVAAASLLWLAISVLQTICLAIAAGILATVRTTAWIQAVVWAEIFAALLFLCKEAVWFLSMPRGAAPSVWAGLAASSLLAVCALVSAVLYGGHKVKVSWQDEVGAGRQPLWLRMFSESNFWRTAFHWDTRKARDKNPIAWLQEYNWTSRLTKWGWCALLFLAQARMLFYARRYLDYQLQLYALVALGIAFSAAASFRQERLSGALELLLVTPISAGKLILGRLQGIWFHFFPPLAILATVWIMGPNWIALPHRYLFYLAGAYLFIPPVGFYISLRTPNVLVGWLLTVFMALFVPFAAIQSFRDGISRSEAPAVFFSVQAMLALAAVYLLHENLVKRRFVVTA